MRRLLPSYTEDLTETDLLAAYAYPETANGGWWLRANMVSTADGAATAGGVSSGVSGEADRRLFLLLRALADIVMVGARTVRIEGYGPARPHEAYAARRQAAGQPPAPTIAVISNSLDLDFSSRLFTEALMPTVVVTADVAPPERLAAASTAGEVVVAGDSKVDLSVALTELARRGHRRMLCEGGPHLLAQATEAGLLDELCLTLSPLLAAGTASRILTGATLTELAPLQLRHVLEEDGYLFLRYLLAR